MQAETIFYFIVSILRIDTPPFSRKRAQFRRKREFLIKRTERLTMQTMNAARDYKQIISRTVQPHDLSSNGVYRRVERGRGASTILAVLLFAIPLLLMNGCGNNSRNIIREGNLLLESGDFIGARQRYEKVLRQEPTNYAAHYGLGMSWCAETIYRTELGLAKPEDWFPAIYHMTISMNVREDERVMKTLAILHFNLGTCFRKEKDIENAIRLIEQSLLYDPTLLKALNLLGALYHERKNYERAQYFYSRAVAVSPEYALAHFNLGALSWAQREYTEALLHFQKAAALDPDNGNFKNWVLKAKDVTGKK